MKPRRGVVIASVALLLSSSGCAAALRERVTAPLATAEKAPWSLNRELLMPVTKRILIAVDLAAGHPPERAALDTLARVASRYGERPASWTAIGWPGAPRIRFAGDTPHFDVPPDRDTSYIVVRYLGKKIPNWGVAYTAYAGNRTIYIIAINQERHRDWRGLLPERHLEAQTLVHEYGHHLGLPTADHGYYPHYPDTSEGMHCVNPDCALAKPRARALLYGSVHTFLRHRYLEDYCAECRAAIAAAKKYWRAGVDTGPARFRLD